MSDTDLSRRLDRLDKAVTADQKLSRSEKRQLKRERRREREMKEASVVGGSVMLLAAVVLAVVGVLNPEKWWLLFVALSIGLGGGKQIEQARRRARLGPPQQEPAAVKQVDRFEQACDRLLAELKDSPAVVRDFLGKPEATVEAIRSACRQLKQRQEQMLETVSPERAADLAQNAKRSKAAWGTSTKRPTAGRPMR